MAEKSVQGAPTSFSEAWQRGVEIGLDLNKAKADIRETIAHRIRICRNTAKMTQEQVSDLIHANRLTYRGYENCRSDIPIAYLVRIADVFNVSLDYLTGRTDEVSQGGSNTPDTSARLAQLEKMVAQLMNAQDGNG